MIIKNEYLSAFLSDQEDCDFYDEDYEDCITKKSQCKTIEGTLRGFPFMFRGKEITNCISTPPRRTQKWCPTQTDSVTGVPVRGQWGYCNDQCSTEGSEISNYF